MYRFWYTIRMFLLVTVIPVGKFYTFLENSSISLSSIFKFLIACISAFETTSVYYLNNIMVDSYI